MKWDSVMNFSEKTVSILKNYSTINQSLLFRKGNVIKTISPQKTILAQATIEEEIPTDFGIYELNKFLGTLCLFSDHEVFISEHYMTIKSGASQSKYFFADPETIQTPPDKPLPIDNVLCEFTLGQNDFKSVMQGANVLQLPEITIEGKNGDIWVVARDSKNTTTNTFERKVGEMTKQNVSFQSVLKVENLKMMPESYDCKITASGLLYMKSADGALQYWVASENNSKYGD